MSGPFNLADWHSGEFSVRVSADNPDGSVELKVRGLIHKSLTLAINPKIEDDNRKIAGVKWKLSKRLCDLTALPVGRKVNIAPFDSVANAISWAHKLIDTGYNTANFSLLDSPLISDAERAKAEQIVIAWRRSRGDVE